MKNFFLLSFALAAGLPALAASPFKGSEPAEGKYYLYQVESDQWLQANMSKIDQWTTHAELGEVGMEVELKKLEGFEGFQIYCNFTNNGELNGSDEDRFFLDQGDRQLCDWIFTPDGDGYTVMIKERHVYNDNGDPNYRHHIENDTYIGYNPDEEYGGLSDKPQGKTWQLVSREERLQKMQEDAKVNGKADASWLIPWFDRGRNDRRDGMWQTWAETDGGGSVLNGRQGYPVQEFWHQWLMDQHITLTDLPKGTYGFTVQGYYRDTEIESPELAERMLNGTENLDRVSYYANSTSANMMSIYAAGKDENPGGETYEIAGKWVPNSMAAAGEYMINGKDYVNEWISTPVTDGNLTIGVKKTGRDHRDWLIYKRFFLEYQGVQDNSEIMATLKGQLEELLEKAKTLPQTPYCSAEIENASKTLAEAEGSDDETLNSIQAAISSLKNAVDAVEAARRDVEAYIATAELFEDAEADAQFAAATSGSQYSEALKTLRRARVLAATDTEEHAFEGNEPKEGKFYLYNVGHKKFLCGGSDWGAHAALGFPGVELTLIADGDNFKIQTGLHNGGVPHDFLTNSGYMDGDEGASGRFSFIPVEGASGVYNVKGGDGYAIWNPNGRTDAGNVDEFNVSFNDFDVDLNNEDSHWILVSRDDRDALMADASAENPVDISYYIASPNFNQREDIDAAWSRANSVFSDRGGNRNVFVAESYNSDNMDFSQVINGLPEGFYQVEVQAYYRNGRFEEQTSVEPIVNGYLYAGSEEVKLPYILEEANNAPGLGDNLETENGVLNIPNNMDQAGLFFKHGLYKTTLMFQVAAPAEEPAAYALDENEGNSVKIGVRKNEKGLEGDWIVLDNFRLKYYGKDDPTGVEKIEDCVETADGPIFNLQGIRVPDATLPGIYIKNGSKFVVK